MKIFVRNKKGSLSLSMEAIVILILAVVMLGLGLAFVRTMFTNIQEKANKALDIGELENKPTESDQVTFSPNTPAGKVRQEIPIKIGFYNPSTEHNYWRMKVLDDTGGIDDPCGGIDPDTADRQCYGGSINAIYKDTNFKLEKDQTTGWYIIFKPQDGAVPTGESTKPFLLTVMFCSAKNDDMDSDCDDSDSEVYQKELYLTVRP